MQPSLPPDVPLLPFRHPCTGEFVDPDNGSTQEERSSGSVLPWLLIHGAGGDSSGLGVTDTHNLPPRRGLRIVSWNLQDLGGGPSRGPRRADHVIVRIATILTECNADIIAILEVKRRIYLPPKPVSPEPPPRTRGRDTTADVDAELQRRQAEFVIKLQEWEAMRALAQQTDASAAPGILELDRIVAAMNGISGGNIYARMEPEKTLPPEQVFTEGETYGFIYKRAAMIPVSFELMVRDGNGGALHWPEPGYRAPARARFQPHQWPNAVDVVAFHAPAPHHGEITHRAIQQFSRIRWTCDTVIAGDFNVDTEARDSDASEQALDTLLSFYDGYSEFCLSVRGFASGTIDGNDVADMPLLLTGIFHGFFERHETNAKLVRFTGSCSGLRTWTDGAPVAAPIRSQIVLVFREAHVQSIDAHEIYLSDTSREQAINHAHTEALLALQPQNFPAIEDWIDRALPHFERESYSVAAESTETSLRKKVETIDYDPFDRRICGYADACVFNNAGYDKLFVIPVTPRPTLNPIRGWAYPLFERCIPLQLWDAFAEHDLRPEATTGLWATLLTQAHLDQLQNMRGVRQRLAQLRAQRAAAAATATVPMFASDDSSDDSSYSAGDSQYEDDADTDDEQAALYPAGQHGILLLKALAQNVLTEANQISDHVPMILDVELLP